MDHSLKSRKVISHSSKKLSSCYQENITLHGSDAIYLGNYVACYFTSVSFLGGKRKRLTCLCPRHGA